MISHGLAIVGCIALLVCIISLCALHLLPHQFHWVRDPVSYYVASRYGFLYRVQVVASGLCGLCVALAFLLGNASLPLVGLVFVGIYALARIVIAAFPADVDTPRTRTNTIHGILAVITFASISAATGVLDGHIQGLSFWHGPGWLLTLSAYLTIVSAALLFLTYLLKPLKGVVGLVERGIYLGALLWLALVLLFALL